MVAGLGFRVRGCWGRAPWPAGLEERLAAAVGRAAAADRWWLGEVAWAFLSG
jgi:hypothetical protein